MCRLFIWKKGRVYSSKNLNDVQNRYRFRIILTQPNVLLSLIATDCFDEPVELVTIMSKSRRFQRNTEISCFSDISKMLLHSFQDLKMDVLVWHFGGLTVQYVFIVFLRRFLPVHRIEN